MDLSNSAIVPEPTEDRLARRQLVGYRSEDCIERLLAFDKNLDKTEEYAVATVKARIYRMDHF